MTNGLINIHTRMYDTFLILFIKSKHIPHMFILLVYNVGIWARSGQTCLMGFPVCVLVYKLTNNKIYSFRMSYIYIYNYYIYYIFTVVHDFKNLGLGSGFLLFSQMVLPAGQLTFSCLGQKKAEKSICKNEPKP